MVLASNKYKFVHNWVMKNLTQSFEEVGEKDYCLDFL